MAEAVRIIVGDVMAGLAQLADASVHCCVTSPPYWGLRDYGVEGQIGLEPTPEAFVARMVEVFRGVRRVLREDGTLWLNLGDCYAATGKSGGGTQGEQWAQAGADYTGPRGGKWRPAPDGLKPKDLCMMPWRVALALQADGWWIRSVIVWAKKSPMPESVTDRPTSSWEPIFLMSKAERYWYDAEAVREANVTPAGTVPNVEDLRGEGFHDHADDLVQGQRNGKPALNPAGRNQRNVWHLGPEPYADAHFATFPTEIPRRAIKAGCPAGGCVLDPFMGSGTTLAVARQLGRTGVGIELNPEYAELARIRIGKAEKPDTFVDPRIKDSPLFTGT